MTIANGSPILAADLAALTTAALALLQADNAQAPGAVHHSRQFFAVVASTDAHRRKAIWTPPANILVETVAVRCAELTAASTTTVRVTDNVGLFPFEVSGTTGAGTTQLTRRLFDGTVTNVGKDFATTSRALWALLKGSRVTIEVETTSVAAGSAIQVDIVGREFFQRVAA